MASTPLSHRAISRALRLPPPTTGYRVHRGLRVPMRDGVELLADHYAPDTHHPLGTILVRCPYGRSFPFSFIYAQIYAARGYHVLFQSVRGTFGSGGVFVPMVHEADDAADTVVWLREQPWFTGTFGTIGLSYLGFTQWALMSDPPPELAAAVISVGPHDLHGTSWGTGSFALNDFLGWADMMAHQEQGMVPRLRYQINAPQRTARGAQGLPLGEGGRALLGHRSPWYEGWLEHPEADDPFWEPMRMTAALDRCTVPVLLLTGWQDVFLNQTLDQFRHLHQRGVDVAMTVGPWTHDEMVTKATGVTAAETLAWMDRHLSGHRTQARSAPVRVCVTGRSSRRWETMADWPPATRDATLYLQPGAGLEPEPPAVQGLSTFRYDPADPTPSVGGRLLSRQAGYCDDTELSRRVDVLSFTSAPLDHEVLVYGHPVLELDHTCDIGYFDVFARVSEVDERGRSHNVSDGFLRFSGEPDGPIRLQLDATAHRFSPGSRIRVMIAGGSHPRFARNLGTGEPAVSGHRMVASTHTVRLGATSKLILPVG
ncbi:MAG: CocE/NonD family hydrolase [Mycobacterium sp.]